MLKPHKKGFSLVEVMIIVIVISILVGITVVAFNTQQKHSRDSRAATSALALSSALDNYYSDRGNYPVSCDVGTADPLQCSSLSDTYTSSQTIPFTVTPQTTKAQLIDYFPEIDPNFTHPRNQTVRVVNQRQGSQIASNSFFLLSMDMVPGSAPIVIPPGPGPIDPCPRGGCQSSNGLDEKQAASLVVRENSDVKVLRAQASTVSFQNPAGGSFTCSFELTGKNSQNNTSVRSHQYIIGFVSEVENKWQFFISPSKIDNNVLDWNNTNVANCEAENIDQLKNLVN